MNTITIKNQTLSYLGDASMLLCPLTTFLCSHRVPEGVSDAIRQWVEGLDTANTCVVCGNLTGEERYVRRLLVERGIPVVLALANAIPENLAELRLNSPELEALNTGHMVVISPIVDATIKDASGKTSAARFGQFLLLHVLLQSDFTHSSANLLQNLDLIHFICIHSLYTAKR